MAININALIESQVGFEEALDERLSAPNMRYIDPRATSAVRRVARTFGGAMEQGLPAAGRAASAVASGLGYLNPARWAGAAYGALAKRVAPRLAQQRTAELWRAGGYGTPAGVRQMDVDTFGQSFDLQRNRLNEVIRPIYTWLATFLTAKGDLKLVPTADSFQLQYKGDVVTTDEQFRKKEGGANQGKPRVPAPSEIYSKLIAPLVDPAQSAEVDLNRRLGVALDILSQVEKLTTVLGDASWDDDVRARWTGAQVAWTKVSRTLPALESAASSNVPATFLAAFAAMATSLKTVFDELTASQSTLAYLYTRVGLALTQAARAGYSDIAIDVPNREDEFSSIAPRRPTGTDVAWTNPKGWWRDEKNEPMLNVGSAPEPPEEPPPETPPPPAPTPSPTAGPVGPGIGQRLAGAAATGAKAVAGAAKSAGGALAARAASAIQAAAIADREKTQAWLAQQGQDVEEPPVEEFGSAGASPIHIGSTVDQLISKLEYATDTKDRSALPGLFTAFAALPAVIRNTPKGQQFSADLRKANTEWVVGDNSPAPTLPDTRRTMADVQKKFAKELSSIYTEWESSGDADAAMRSLSALGDVYPSRENSDRIERIRDAIKAGAKQKDARSAAVEKAKWKLAAKQGVETRSKNAEAAALADVEARFSTILDAWGSGDDAAIDSARGLLDDIPLSDAGNELRTDVEDFISDSEKYPDQYSQYESFLELVAARHLQETNR